MLNDEICKLRDKLNKSIEQGDDYSITYQLSIELDELIAKYYKELKDTKKKLMMISVWIDYFKNIELLNKSTSVSFFDKMICLIFLRK